MTVTGEPQQQPGIRIAALVVEEVFQRFFQLAGF
jgi:hypothetical protein